MKHAVGLHSAYFPIQVTDFRLKRRIDQVRSKNLMHADLFAPFKQVEVEASIQELPELGFTPPGRILKQRKKLLRWNVLRLEVGSGAG